MIFSVSVLLCVFLGSVWTANTEYSNPVLKQVLSFQPLHGQLASVDAVFVKLQELNDILKNYNLFKNENRAECLNSKLACLFHVNEFLVEVNVEKKFVRFYLNDVVTNLEKYKKFFAVSTENYVEKVDPIREYIEMPQEYIQLFLESTEFVKEVDVFFQFKMHPFSRFLNKERKGYFQEVRTQDHDVAYSFFSVIRFYSVDETEFMKWKLNMEVEQSKYFNKEKFEDYSQLKMMTIRNRRQQQLFLGTTNTDMLKEFHPVEKTFSDMVEWESDPKQTSLIAPGDLPTYVNHYNFNDLIKKGNLFALATDASKTLKEKLISLNYYEGSKEDAAYFILQWNDDFSTISPNETYSIIGLLLKASSKVYARKQEEPFVVRLAYLQLAVWSFELALKNYDNQNKNCQLTNYGVDLKSLSAFVLNGVDLTQSGFDRWLYQRFEDVSNQVKALSKDQKNLFATSDTKFKVITNDPEFEHLDCWLQHNLTDNSPLKQDFDSLESRLTDKIDDYMNNPYISVNFEKTFEEMVEESEYTRRLCAMYTNEEYQGMEFLTLRRLAEEFLGLSFAKDCNFEGSSVQYFLRQRNVPIDVEVISLLTGYLPYSGDVSVFSEALTNVGQGNALSLNNVLVTRNTKHYVPLAAPLFPYTSVINTIYMLMKGVFNLELLSDRLIVDAVLFAVPLNTLNLPEFHVYMEDLLSFVSGKIVSETKTYTLEQSMTSMKLIGYYYTLKARILSMMIDSANYKKENTTLFGQETTLADYVVKFRKEANIFIADQQSGDGSYPTVIVSIALVLSYQNDKAIDDMPNFIRAIHNTGKFEERIDGHINMIFRNVIRKKSIEIFNFANSTIGREFVAKFLNMNQNYQIVGSGLTTKDVSFDLFTGKYYVNGVCDVIPKDMIREKAKEFFPFDSFTRINSRVVEMITHKGKEMFLDTIDQDVFLGNCRLDRDSISGSLMYLPLPISNYHYWRCGSYDLFTNTKPDLKVMFRVDYSRDSKVWSVGSFKSGIWQEDDKLEMKSAYYQLLKVSIQKYKKSEMKYFSFVDLYFEDGQQVVLQQFQDGDIVLSKDNNLIFRGDVESSLCSSVTGLKFEVKNTGKYKLIIPWTTRQNSTAELIDFNFSKLSFNNHLILMARSFYQCYDYERSFEMLKKISHNAKFSTLALNGLESLILSDVNSPWAASVRLLAFHSLKRNIKMFAGSSDPNLKAGTKAIYLRGSYQIPFSMSMFPTFENENRSPFSYLDNVEEATLGSKRTIKSEEVKHSNPFPIAEGLRKEVSESNYYFGENPSELAAPISLNEIRISADIETRSVYKMYLKIRDLDLSNGRNADNFDKLVFAVITTKFDRPINNAILVASLINKDKKRVEKYLYGLSDVSVASKLECLKEAKALKAGYYSYYTHLVKITCKFNCEDTDFKAFMTSIQPKYSPVNSTLMIGNVTNVISDYTKFGNTCPALDVFFIEDELKAYREAIPVVAGSTKFSAVLTTGNGFFKEREKNVKDELERANQKMLELKSYQYTVANEKNIMNILQSKYDQLAAKVAGLNKYLGEAIFVSDVEKRNQFLIRRALKWDRDNSDMNSMLPLFLRRNMKFYQESFKTLTSDEINALDNHLEQFFLFKTELMFVERQIALLRQRDFEKFNMEIGQPRSQVAATDDAYRLILCFEYAANIRVRDEQAKDVINRLLSNDNTVVHRLMASGKTFILGTLLAFLKADGQFLSVMIPPTSLLETNAQSMLSRTREFFGQDMIVIEFNRKMGNVNNRLESIENELKIALEKRKFVMMSLETLQSLQNKFIESLDLIAPSGVISNEVNEIDATVRLLKRILSLFKEKAFVTFDEIDMIFSPFKETNYPGPMRIHIPPFIIDAVADLMLHLAFSEEVNKLPHRLNLQANDQASFLWYREEIEPIVATFFFEKIKKSQNFMDVVGSLAHELERFMKEGNHDFIYKIVSDEACLKGCRDTIEQIIILRNFASTWIPNAFQKTVNEHFGFSSNRNDYRLARPYAFSQTPNERSEFASQWELLMKTCMTYLVDKMDYSFSMTLTRHFLMQSRLLKMNAVDATKVEDVYNSKFLEATGKNLVDVASFKSEDIEEVMDGLNQNRVESKEVIFMYLKEVILAGIEAKTSQIHNNPIFATATIKKFNGYSGTLENPFIFPHSVYMPYITGKKSNEEKAIFFDLGQNGRVLKRIIDLKTEYVQVNGKPIESLGNLLADCHAVIDIAAQFKDKKNGPNAMKMGELNDAINGILYFDEESNLLMFRRKIRSGDKVTWGEEKVISVVSNDVIKAETGLEPEERMTFYDQRHITGTDISQPANSLALVTIGPSVSIRDLFQGIMRMRLFLSNQKVKIVSTAMFYDTLKATPELKGLDGLELALASTELVQFRDESAENRAVIHHKMIGVARQFVWEAMLASSKPKAIFDRVKDILFYRTLKQDFLSAYNQTEKEVVPFIDELENTKKDILLALKSSSLTKSIIKRLKEELESVIASYPDTQDNDNVADAASKLRDGMEQEAELESELQTEVQDEDGDASLTPSKEGEIALLSTSNTFKLKTEIKKRPEFEITAFDELIPENIIMTSNFAFYAVASPIAIKGRFRKTPSTLVAFKEDGKLMISLVSPFDLTRILLSPDYISNCAVFVNGVHMNGNLYLTDQETEEILNANFLVLIYDMAFRIIDQEKWSDKFATLIGNEQNAKKVANFVHAMIVRRVEADANTNSPSYKKIKSMADKDALIVIVPPALTKINTLRKRGQSLDFGAKRAKWFFITFFASLACTLLVVFSSTFVFLKIRAGKTVVPV